MQNIWNICYGALACSIIGCAPLVSKETDTVLTYHFMDEVVNACPSPNPLMQRGLVVTAIDRYNEAGDKDTGELLRQITATCEVVTALSGQPLDETQLAGYKNLVQAAWLSYKLQYQYMAKQEHRRRAAFVQDAGRTMMEIQRTDDLNRIRRNQDAEL